MTDKPERTSELLRRIAEEGPDGRVSLAMLVELLGDRGFGVLLCLWALPCAMPIPGISTPFGILIMATSFQMVMGLDRPWLPKAALAQSVERAALRRMLSRARPHLERFERFCRPRFAIAPKSAVERALGVFIFILGFILALPIWGANLLPAIAIIIMALGLIERDGAAVLVGVVFGLLSEVVVASVLGTALFVFTKALGAMGLVI